MKTQIAVVAFVSVLGLALPVAAQNIDTRASASSIVGPFGYGSHTTYGQTFRVPAGQSLVTGFSFRLASVPASTTFRGVLMRWDTGTYLATGPILYESGDVNTTGATLQDVNFTIPGGAAVTPGETYIIFGTVLNSAGWGIGDWAFSPADVLPNGDFVTQVSVTPADWTGAGWSFDARDAGVTVNFAPAPAVVPTLSEWAMIGLTLTLAGAGAALVARRRRFVQA